MNRPIIPQNPEFEPRPEPSYLDAVPRRISDFTPEQYEEAFRRLAIHGVHTVDFTAEGYVPFADNPKPDNIASAVSNNSAPSYLKTVDKSLYNQRLNKLNKQNRLLWGISSYLTSESLAKRLFLTNVGQLENYIYDDEKGVYLLANDDPTVGQSYHTSALMVGDMYKWAKVCLPEQELNGWHTRIIENIEPDNWQSNHIDTFGKISSL